MNILIFQHKIPPTFRLIMIFSASFNLWMRVCARYVYVCICLKKFKANSLTKNCCTVFGILVHRSIAGAITRETTCSRRSRKKQRSHNDKQQISQELKLKWLKRVHRMRFCFTVVGCSCCWFCFFVCDWGKVICEVFANHQMHIFCIHFDWLSCICLVIS